MNDAQAVALLEALVRTPSISGDERAAVELFVRELPAFGFRTERDAAGNAVASIGGGAGPRVTLLGHIDCVPGDIPVRREGNRLFGRGTVDAKGPLVAFVAAASRAAADGTLAGPVQIVGCVEEEAPSSKGAHHRAAFPAPDVCVVGEPSRWDGVTVGYKGFLRLSLRRSEPNGHSAAEDPGAAALGCRQFVALEREAASFNAGRAALFEQLLLHLEDVARTTDGLREQVTLHLKLRLPPDLGPVAARTWVEELTPGWEVDVDGGLAAWSAPRTSPVARALGRAILGQGARPRFQRKTGTADANVVAPAWGCPCVAYGPGDSALDHAPDEHVELDELARGIGVLHDFLAAPVAS